MIKSSKIKAVFYLLNFSAIVQGMLRLHVIITMLFLGMSLPLISYAFDLETLRYTEKEAIDIVFVADGFTSDEQALYRDRVDLAIDYLFDNPPFDSYQDAFNIYSIATVSKDSGISVKDTSTLDTALHTFMNRDDLPRYTGIPESDRKVLRDFLKKRLDKKVYVIMLLNTSIYGGSGDLNRENRLLSIMQATLDEEFGVFRELVLHEFGHSFGDMADEYGGSCSSQGRLKDWDPIHYNKANVTLDAVQDPKWDDLVSDPQYYLGANYCDDQWYRSSSNDLMRSLAPGSIHSELGQYLIQQRIEEELRYNAKVFTYKSNGVMELSQQRDRHIRIHADRVTLTSDLYCSDLYIAQDSSLEVAAGVSLRCDSMTILGNLEYLSKKKKSRVRFGCRDPRALNYDRFVRHTPSVCLYEAVGARPPHLLTDTYDLSADHEGVHEH